jgi:hypothetical protein
VLRESLSAALAARRRARGLTQPELAAALGVSVTAVGHAETGRLWHARGFWEHAGAMLGDDGALLRLYDTYQAAVHAAAPGEAAPALPVLPANVAVAPDGVTVTWTDGTETLVRPPGCQDGAEMRKSGE